MHWIGFLYLYLFGFKFILPLPVPSRSHDIPCNNIDSEKIALVTELKLKIALIASQ